MPQRSPQAVARLLIEYCCCFPLQLISSVWSPQSIEFSLQQFCLPFLRLSCLLQHHLYGDNLAGCQVPCNSTPFCYYYNFKTCIDYSFWCLVGSWNWWSTTCVWPQEEDEFSALAVCLGLHTAVPQPSNVVNSASCLQWPVDASDLVTQWCAEVTTLSQIRAEQSLVWPCSPLP